MVFQKILIKNGRVWRSVLIAADAPKADWRPRSVCAERCPKWHRCFGGTYTTAPTSGCCWPWRGPAWYDKDIGTSLSVYGLELCQERLGWKDLRVRQRGACVTIASVKLAYIGPAYSEILALTNRILRSRIICKGITKTSILDITNTFSEKGRSFCVVRCKLW